jgi:hypothetical protein
MPALPNLSSPHVFVLYILFFLYLDGKGKVKRAERQNGGRAEWLKGLKRPKRLKGLKRLKSRK